MKTIVTFKIASQGTILGIMVIALILGYPRTAIPNTETSIQSQKPAEVSDAVSTGDELSERITQLVKSLDYPEKVAEDFILMALDWKGKRRRPALMGWKERLANAHQKFQQGKISRKDVAKIEARILQELCKKIREQFRSEDLGFELPDVIQHRRANCVGYSQLTYIIGNAIGLSIRPINVLECFSTKRDGRNQGHIACIIDLFDGRFVMADVAMFPDVISNTFTLDKHFSMTGNYWELRNKGNPLRIHPRIQLMDRNGLISAIYNNRGIVLDNTGEYDAAITIYNRAIEIASGFANIYNNRGNAYAGKGEYNRAIVDYNKALEINPGNVDTYFNRGITYQNNNEFDRAILDFTKVIEINPGSTEAYVSRGAVYHEKGEYERAILDFNKAIEVNPKYIMAYRNRGAMYILLKKYTEAKKDFLKVVELNPELRDIIKDVSEEYELDLKLN